MPWPPVPLLIKLAVFYIFVLIEGRLQMITLVSGLLSLASLEVGGLVAGSVAGLGLEFALPWMSRAHRARKAVRLMKNVRVRTGQPEMTFEEIQHIGQLA